MKRMLFNATHAEEFRVAIVDGKELIEFDIETINKTQNKGNIYKGIITRVEHSLEACFVDYGTDKQGFLPFKEIVATYTHDKQRDYSSLREGMGLIVQVEKDERGNKGAALTTCISLPGRYLVLISNNSHSGGVSKRIDGDDRDELKAVLAQLEIPDDISIIARTAAVGKTKEELQWDLNYLIKLWQAIVASESSRKGGFLIYQESSLVIRSIRDHFMPDIQELLIDSETIYRQAVQFISHIMPDFRDRIKLYKSDIALFSRFQIEQQIETAYARTVYLPSGGVIVLDHAEALTAIDVNSAKANKGADIEATAVQTNLEAADEIARQIRFRDLGGLIVLDLIDMENPKNKRKVEEYFKQKLKSDRAQIQIEKLSKFGLLELSRQRIKSSLNESTSTPCPRCSGTGVIRGIESMTLHILRMLQEEMMQHEHAQIIHVQVPVAIATYMLNEKRNEITKIESQTNAKILIIPNTHMESPHYKIKKIDQRDALFAQASYNLAEAPDSPAPETSTANHNDAVVQSIAPESPAPNKSIIRKIVENITSIVRSLFTTKTPSKQKRTRSNGKPPHNKYQNKPIRRKTVRHNSKSTSAPNIQHVKSTTTHNAQPTKSVSVNTHDVQPKPATPTKVHQKLTPIAINTSSSSIQLVTTKSQPIHSGENIVTKPKQHYNDVAHTPVKQSRLGQQVITKKEST